MKLTQKLIFFMMPLLFFSFCLAHAKVENAKILIGSVESIQEDPFFKKILGSPSSDKNIEKIKIQYLISRVRQSPHTFIRNQERHTGKQAASHLARKYAVVSGRIRTAGEFIEYIASKSSFTGQAYFIEIDGQKLEAKKVFNDELDFMEEKLATEHKFK